MKYTFILPLCLLTFIYSISNNQIFQELLPQKSLSITSFAFQSELNSDQQIILLNFFYRMHSYCVSDLLYKQASFKLLQMTHDIHNSKDPNNNLAILLEHTKKTILQLEKSAQNYTQTF